MSGSSDYSVVVRLTTIGSSDLAASMKSAQTSTQAVATELDKADISTKRLSTTIRGVTEDGNKYSVTMKQLADSHKAYVSVADQLTGSLLKMGAALFGLNAMKGLVTDIYSAVKAHEDETITLAATMAATNGWANSMVFATGVLEKLKETGALVGETTAQMVGTFTMLKRTFGGTSDDAVTLTEKLALLARQSGTTAEDLATRLGVISVTGKIMPGRKDPTSLALMGVGVDPQVLMTMNAAGQALDYLNAKLSEDPELVAQLKNNWSYLGAELSKVTETSMETVGQGLAPLKKAVKDFTAALDSAEAQAAFDTIGRQLGTLNGQLISLLPNAEAGTSFFASFSTNILKGFNVFLADLIFIWKGLSAAVSGIFDVILNPDKYFAAGGKDRLKAGLDGVVKLYQENQAKIAAIYAAGPGSLAPGSAGFVGPPAPEKPTKPAPGMGTDLSKIAEDNFKAANAVADAWDKAYLETLTGIDKQVAAVDMATQKEIDDFLKPGVTWAQMVDFTVAKTAEGEARKTALIAAEEEKRQKKLAVDAAWYTGEMSKLDDQLAALSDDYYTKQFALIEKKTGAELRAIEERKAHGDLDPNQYANAIAALSTLDAAEQAHLARERDSIVGFRNTMEENAKLLVMTTNSVAGGLQAGWNTVMAGLKTTTESVRDYVVGAWDDIATAFNSSLVAGISGNLNSLKDVFKTFISSLQKTFSTFITDTILPKIKDAFGLANGVGTTGVALPMGTSYSQVAGGQPTTTTGRPPSNTALYASAGLMALGAIGQASGDNTFLGQDANYLSLAASLVTTAGGYVALAVAVVGSLIVAFTAAKADIQETFSGSAMADAVKKGQAVGVSGTPLGDATKAAVDLENSTIAFFAGMFQKADQNFSRDILKTFKDKMIDYLKTINPNAGAGGQADFNADVAKIFNDIIPKVLMHLYFGQTTNLADPGGIGGFQKQWNPRGTTESMVDPNSPLVKFLTNLGLTIRDVGVIASQIDLLTPEEFQKYFSGIVGAIIDFKNNIKNLSQSWAEIQVAISAAEHPDVVAQFATAGAAIVQTAKDLSLYSGQTWADKAKELNTTADQYYYGEQ